MVLQIHSNALEFCPGLLVLSNLGLTIRSFICPFIIVSFRKYLWIAYHVSKTHHFPTFLPRVVVGCEFESSYLLYSKSSQASPGMTKSRIQKTDTVKWRLMFWNERAYCIHRTQDLETIYSDKLSQKYPCDVSTDGNKIPGSEMLSVWASYSPIPREEDPCRGCAVAPMISCTNHPSMSIQRTGI